MHALFREGITTCIIKLCYYLTSVLDPLNIRKLSYKTIRKFLYICASLIKSQVIWSGQLNESNSSSIEGELAYIVLTFLTNMRYQPTGLKIMSY